MVSLNALRLEDELDATVLLAPKSPPALEARNGVVPLIATNVFRRCHNPTEEISPFAADDASVEHFSGRRTSNRGHRGAVSGSFVSCLRRGGKVGGDWVECVFWRSKSHFLAVNIGSSAVFWSFVSDRQLYIWGVGLRP
jgi:hypothetical protein